MLERRCPLKVWCPGSRHKARHSNWLDGDGASFGEAWGNQAPGLGAGAAEEERGVVL